MNAANTDSMMVAAATTTVLAEANPSSTAAFAITMMGIMLSDTGDEEHS